MLIQKGHKSKIPNCKGIPCLLVPKANFLHILLIVAFNLLLIFPCAYADQHLQISQLSNESFILDGKLDEALWAEAENSELAYVIFPYENTKSMVKTQAYIFQSAQSLYIGFKAFDPNMHNLHAFYRAHDRAWHDDNVGVKFDTFHDAKLVYRFVVNPYGIKGDSIENGTTGKKSDSWDGIWQAAASINNDGYSVEMVIPLSILNLPESNGEKTWGVVFERHYPRELKYYLSDVPVDRNNSCRLCQMATLTGVKAKNSSTDLTIVPAVVASSNASRDLSENTDWNKTKDTQVGADINWGISADTRLTATLNPDFSQIEADAAQLSLNNTFSLSLREKRRFFLENNDFFSSYFNLIYTRNIADPNAGLKVTSRHNNHTVAAMVTNDTQTNVLLPGNLNSSIKRLDENSRNAAFRYRYDFSNDFSIGATSTLRQSDSFRNALVSFDGLYRFNQQTRLEMQWAGATTESPYCLTDSCDTSDFSDHAYRINFHHESRDWTFRTNHSYFGKNFRAGLGFEGRADFVKTIIGGSRVWYLSNSWLHKVEIYSDVDKTTNTHSDFIEEEWEGFIRLNGLMQSNISFQAGVRNRVGPRKNKNDLAITTNTQRFSEDYARLRASFKPLSNLYLVGSITTGQKIDNTYVHDIDGDGVREFYGREGQFVEHREELIWDVNRHLSLNLKRVVNKLDVDDIMAFKVDLSDLRLAYQFDAKHRLRVAIIYKEKAFNPSSYEFAKNPQSSEMATQITYSYSLNPGTVAFLGYSDGRIENESDDITSLTKNQQNMFAKLSYAF